MALRNCMAECAALDDEIGALETILAYDLKINHLDLGKEAGPERGAHE